MIAVEDHSSSQTAKSVVWHTSEGDSAGTLALLQNDIGREVLQAFLAIIRKEKIAILWGGDNVD